METDTISRQRLVDFRLQVYASFTFRADALTEGKINPTAVCQALVAAEPTDALTVAGYAVYALDTTIAPRPDAVPTQGDRRRQPLPGPVLPARLCRNGSAGRLAGSPGDQSGALRCAPCAERQAGTTASARGELLGIRDIVAALLDVMQGC